MRLLLDENVSPIVGDALKAAGHDIRMVASVCPGASDEDVVRLAQAEGRVLVTEDNDFGELAFQQGLHSPGLIRLALHGHLPAQKAARLVQAIEKGIDADGVAIVVEPARIRRRRMPGAP